VTAPGERIRLAWWSLRAFPLVLAAGGAGFLFLWQGLWSAPRAWGLMVLLVGLLVYRLASVEFFLGERWMRVPGPHSWTKELLPLAWWQGIPRNEPQYSEGRLVRLSDVESWRRRDGGVELRLRDGRSVNFTLLGLRTRDRKRVLDYLLSHLGG
jgi:hypothetical protein